MSTPAGLDGRDASTALATSEGQVELLKAAFRRHATGVALVTASGPDGPVGLTASSVASVSTRPPALSFSVLTGSATGRIVAEAAAFCERRRAMLLVDPPPSWADAATARAAMADGAEAAVGTASPNAVLYLPRLRRSDPTQWGVEVFSPKLAL